MKNFNIPTWVIVLCFIFGAWPVGIFLAILNSVGKNARESDKAAQRRQTQFENTSSYAQPKNKTVYHSNYQSSGNNNFGYGKTNYKTQEEVRAELAKMREELAAKNAEAMKKKSEDSSNTEENVQPNTTYHYSYVKKSDPQENVRVETKTDEKTSFGTSERVKNTAKTQKYNPINFVKTNFKKSGATVFSTIAMVVSVFFSVIFFIDAVDWVTSIGIAASVTEIVTAMISSTVSAMLYLFRQYYKTRDYRIITYLSVLRNEKYYSIQKLAQIADVSTARATKDLHYMQSKGLLGQFAVIDKGMQYLILSPDGRKEAEAEFNRTSDLAKNEQAEKDAENKESVISDEENLSEHEVILRRIRELNDDIDDVVVSEKIDRIEELTRKIFKLVEEKPELKNQLQSFLSYYLPTTLKLLNSYAYFEEQGIKGENISAGMKNIEETLDMLISGYQNQLDKLFEADALDVTTDINVLEQMMKADGFTGQKDFDTQNSFETEKTFEDSFGGSGTATLELPEEYKKN